MSTNDIRELEDIFQSTLPAWGETKPGKLHGAEESISIHSPRMGRDRTIRRIIRPGKNFNPLSPHGERRDVGLAIELMVDFNPLSPHGERHATTESKMTLLQFQSTLPAWGETRSSVKVGLPYSDFNPLSPHGERRRSRCCRPCSQLISIHSPRMGRDASDGPAYTAPDRFQSTLPAWGETPRPGGHNG